MEEAQRLSESQRPAETDAAAVSSTADSTSTALAAATLATESSAKRAIEPSSGDPVAASEQASGEPSNAELDRLSIEDAERFASAFRPTWEPTMAIAAAAVAPSFHPQPAEAEPTRVAISELPGAHRGSAWAIAGAAILGFFVLAGLGWATTRTSAPASKAAIEAQQEPAIPAPVEASPAPVAARPTPLAAPEAAPIEAVPSEAAPTEAPPAEAAAIIPAAEPVAAEAPAALPETNTEPEPIMLALQISTSPREAQLLLDGAPVPNPFDARLPKGGSYRVDAAAPGYTSSNLTIELTRDRRVALKLKPERVAAPEAAPKPAAAPAPTRKAEPRRAARAARRAATAPKKGAGFVADSPY